MNRLKRNIEIAILIVVVVLLKGAVWLFEKVKVPLGSKIE